MTANDHPEWLGQACSYRHCRYAFESLKDTPYGKPIEIDGKVDHWEHYCDFFKCYMPEEWERANRPPAPWEAFFSKYLCGEEDFNVIDKKFTQNQCLIWETPREIFNAINNLMVKRRLVLSDDFGTGVGLLDMIGKQPPLLMRWSGRPWLDDVAINVSDVPL